MSSPPATDPELVRGLRAGRHDAFERLYGEYHASIYNLCARIVGDREEAKDLTQEVFIKAFGQLPQQSEDMKLRAWLYRVATNACFNALRKRGQPSDGESVALEDVPAGRDEFQRAGDVALIEESLAQLNERYRTALVLKDLQGLGAAEIASVLEITRPNADVLVHRARAAFRVAFAKLGGGDAPAPASLAFVLVPLSVPAALHVMPPLPAPLAVAPHGPAGPAHGLPHPGISSSAGPAGAGLLTKIGAALTSKAAITAAAAAVIIGGAVAVHELGTRDAAPDAAAATSAEGSAPVASGAGLGLGDHGAEHHGRWAGHGWPIGDHRHHAEHHGGAEAGHHAGDHSGTGEQAHAATHDSGESLAVGTIETHHIGMTTSTTSSGDHSADTSTHHDGGDGSEPH
jgi:RNA polymerase sigma-70 factor (ECF subfamily)